MTRGLQCSSLVLDETTENTFRLDDIHHITVPNFNTRLEGTNSHVRAGNYGRLNNDEKCILRELSSLCSGAHSNHAIDKGKAGRIISWCKKKFPDSES